MTNGHCHAFVASLAVLTSLASLASLAQPHAFPELFRVEARSSALLNNQQVSASQLQQPQQAPAATSEPSRIFHATRCHHTAQRRALASQSPSCCLTRHRHHLARNVGNRAQQYQPSSSQPTGWTLHRSCSTTKNSRHGDNTIHRDPTQRNTTQPNTTRNSSTYRNAIQRNPPRHRNPRRIHTAQTGAKGGGVDTWPCAQRTPQCSKQ